MHDHQPIGTGGHGLAVVTHLTEIRVAAISMRSQADDANDERDPDHYAATMSKIPQDGQPTWQPGDSPASWQPDPGLAGLPVVPGGGLEPQISDEPVLVTIGDISVTQSRVFTPSGWKPVSEVSWTLTDMSQTTQSIPAWAIVCTVVFFLFCLLGLLFLLVKETRTQGSVQVTVTGPGFVHTTQIPVTSAAQIADISARLNHARAVTASAQAELPQDGLPQTGLPQTGQQGTGEGRRPDIWNQPSQGQEPTQGQ